MSRTALNAAHPHFARADLTPTAKLVLYALAHRHNQETGRCDPSVVTIARDIGVSERSVQYAIRQLCDAKAITVTERKRRTGRGRRDMTHRYRILGYAGQNMGAKFASTPVQNLHPKREDRNEPSPAAFDDILMMVEDDRMELPEDGFGVDDV